MLPPLSAWKKFITPFLGAAVAVLPFCVELAEPFLFIKVITLDVVALVLAITLFNTLGLTAKEFRRTGSEWRFAQLMIEAMASILLLLWFSKWLDGYSTSSSGNGGFKHSTDHYLPFLHAAAILIIALLFLRARSANQWKNWLKETPARTGLLLYILTSFIGGYLLIMPWSVRGNTTVHLVDALFVAVSALTVTGLSTVQIDTTFTTFGHFIILLLIQLGGLGIVSLSVVLAGFTRRRMSLSGMVVTQEMQGMPNLGATTPFIYRAILLTLGIEALGATYLYLTLPPPADGLRLFNAVFHSVSAFCNAGFSLYPNNLVLDNAVMGCSGIGLLIVLGSIGFPVLFELGGRMLPQGRRQRTRGNISGYVRLTLMMTGLLYVFGTGALFLLETLYEGADLPFLTRMGHALFYSVSSRTAGFNVHDISVMSLGGQLTIALLMIIGGSPLSTAGGIKTTTAGVILIATTSVLSGRKWMQFHKREIPLNILLKSVAVITIYFAILIVALLILLLTESVGAWPLTFEAISALSTTGLSVGATTKLTSAGKIIIMFLMIVGRAGLLTLMYASMGTAEPQRFRYPKEELYVG